MMRAVLTVPIVSVAGESTATFHIQPSPDSDLDADVMALQIVESIKGGFYTIVTVTETCIEVYP